MITPSTLNLFSREATPFTENTFQVSLTIPETLPYFDGHFPGNPVLPGVAMMDLSLEALRVHAEENRSLVGVRSAKYLALIQPQDTVQIACTKNSDSEWQVVWNKEGKKVCDLVLNFS